MKHLQSEHKLICKLEIGVLLIYLDTVWNLKVILSVACFLIRFKDHWLHYFCPCGMSLPRAQPPSAEAWPPCHHGFWNEDFLQEELRATKKPIPSAFLSNVSTWFRKMQKVIYRLQKNLHIIDNAKHAGQPLWARNEQILCFKIFVYFLDNMHWLKSYLWLDFCAATSS